MPILGTRLKKASEMVVGGIPLIDVGTDHAYLPVHLIKSGVVPYAYAGDIGEKPLKNAELAVTRYGLNEKIRLSVSDGLKGFNFRFPDKINITICGMGGTLIVKILSESREKVARDGVHLVLQPMTHSEDVRKWLCENGFSIVSEDCVRDCGRIYCCISADYTGEIVSLDEGFFYFGTLTKNTEEQSAFISAQIGRVRKRLDAITEARLYPDEQKTLISICDYYESRYGE